MTLNISRFIAGILSGAVGLCLTGTPAAASDITIKEAEDHLRVDIDGELFTEYHFKGAPHVYFYPVLGPNQVELTRNAPMKSVADEDADHPHHRSLWFSHGEVNGVDFWSESPKAGKIVHNQFLQIKSGKTKGTIQSENRWIAPDGREVCNDQTTVHFQGDKKSRLIDFEITLRAAADQNLTLGDTKEGTMAIRIAETMRLKPNKFNVGKPTGHIVLSTGLRDGETWGKRAAWCDYFGPVKGEIVGIAIFDHPKNPIHPTRWHVRDYGLFAANPFGVHDFEGKPAGAGNLQIKPGQGVTFRYRFYLHLGDEQQAKVADRYQQYVAEFSTLPVRPR